MTAKDTLPALAATKTLVLTYVPSEDWVYLDGAGLSPLEIRGMVEMAADSLGAIDYTAADTATDSE